MGPKFLHKAIHVFTRECEGMKHWMEREKTLQDGQKIGPDSIYPETDNSKKLIFFSVQYVVGTFFFFILKQNVSC